MGDIFLRVFWFIEPSKKVFYKNVKNLEHAELVLDTLSDFSAFVIGGANFTGGVEKWLENEQSWRRLHLK